MGYLAEIDTYPYLCDSEVHPESKATPSCGALHTTSIHFYVDLLQVLATTQSLYLAALQRTEAVIQLSAQMRANPAALPACLVSLLYNVASLYSRSHA